MLSFRNLVGLMHRARRPQRSNKLSKPAYIVSHRIAYRAQPIDNPGLRRVDLLE